MTIVQRENVNPGARAMCGLIDPPVGSSLVVSFPSQWCSIMNAFIGDEDKQVELLALSLFSNRIRISQGEKRPEN